MKAVILAAGIARRLAPLTDRAQKCLMPVGNRPLLMRMLTALASVGVGEAVIVVGHYADQVRAIAGQRVGRMAVTYVENPDYARGSSVSLYAARAHLTGPVLVMDADVLFPREFLRRLLATPAPSAFLLDRQFTDSGEEVKLYTRGARVIALGKKAVPEAWETMGEGVGFFKCGAEAAPRLPPLLERVIAETDGAGEYEEALHLLVQERHADWVDITGLPWTEIDFVEDLRRAREEVLPRITMLD
ncbi:MAG: phosphocholine cytidylyltransferase family protein [Candidatus Rokubacteria bacterium]|nr:phosphocholine cytidylyltransferase family protein [Candidatus Rokubacteria bacterium]